MLGPDRLGVLPKHEYAGEETSGCDGTRVEDYIHLFL